jgi:hypothetical protein
MATGLEISSKIELLLRLREESGDSNIDYDAMLEVAEKSFSEKLTAYTYALNNMHMASALLSDRAQNLKAKSKALDNEEKRLKDHIKYILENSPNVVAISSEKDKFTLCESPESLELKIKTSSRSISKVLDYDSSYVPTEFIDIVTLRTLNTEKVRQYLKDGNELDWAELKTSKHVRIT